MQELTTLLTFRYRGLFQFAEIRFHKIKLEQGYKIICEAEVKLPILKKSYSMSTDYRDDLLLWSEHTPAHENGTLGKSVAREQIYTKESNIEVLDPIGFFLLLDEDAWTQNNVNLLIGPKIITLDLAHENRSETLEIRRREKDQKLIVHRNEGRISKIEIPVPVLGSLSLERVTS